MNMYMQVWHTCIHAWVYGYVWLWRPEKEDWCPITFCLISLRHVSHWTLSLLLCGQWSSRTLLFPSSQRIALQICPAMFGFYTGHRDWNSVPCVCAANAFTNWALSSGPSVWTISVSTSPFLISLQYHKESLGGIGASQAPASLFSSPPWTKHE